mmetsp:Transcript_9038/g.22312  ORF Transcript_9038/g.22312 Transcript_9038/m.22312 type:complete len:311 (+) Transcript_9038:103-1035(+)
MVSARDGMVVCLVTCLCGIIYTSTFGNHVLLSSEFLQLHAQTTKTGLADAIKEGIKIGRRAAPLERGNSSAPSLSSQDSSGFLEYNDDQWMRMRGVHQAQSLRQHGLGIQSTSGRKFFQANWEPTLSCAFEQRLGKIGDGGKWVCDAYRIAEAEMCNVVSIGSNNDWSFEQAVHKLNPRCKIFTFDHTITPHNVPAYVTFHKIGLGTSDNGPLLTVGSALRKIGLENKTVDIFKIDCEGCERNIFLEFLKPDLRQILIEVHSANWPVNSFFEAMNSAGYVIFHKEPNTYGCGGNCIEYGFLKLKPEFALL